MPLSFQYPAGIIIDNTSLTDQGRSPVSVEKRELSNIVELASGKRKKYSKAVKTDFSISWEWLPTADADTIDGLGARDTIKALAFDPATHTLKFSDSAGGETVYTVFIDDYSEELIRRDTSGKFFWNVTISMSEQ